MKYIIALGGVQGLNIGIGLVRTKLVALILGPIGMGIMSLYSSSVQLVQNFCNIGFDKSCIPSISRAFEENDATTLKNSITQARSLFFLSAMVAFVVSLSLCWLLSLLAFGNVNHALHFFLLSPAAAFLIVCCGETAIMKATRQLKRMAVLSIISIVISLVVSVVLFSIWDTRAVIPSIVIIALGQMVVTLAYSSYRYSYEIVLHKDVIKENMPMIRLGVTFALATAVSSTSEFLVRSFLNLEGTHLAVGLYNTAYMIVFTYGGIVFTALDSEYFPRLSKITDKHLLRQTIMKQIRNCLIIVIPMYVVLFFLLPWIIPLLFSPEFAPAIQMTQIALAAIIFRAIYLPIGYLPVAQGDAKTFFVMETISAVMMLVGVMVGFRIHGMIGCGYGLLISHAMDMIVYATILQCKYHISILRP